MSSGDILLATALYFMAVNWLSYFAFAWDKYCARNGLWRVSESTLLMIAAVGGTIGALVAARRLRHKTHKEPFRTTLRAIAVVHLIAVASMSVPSVREHLWQFLNSFGPAA